MEVFLKDTDRIVTKTDRSGKIIYANNRFLEICGLSKEEVMFKNHNIIRHQDMPKTIFKYVWDELNQGREVFGFVKNKTKNGDFYWVMANIIPSSNINNEKIYTSFRIKPNLDAVKIVDSFYSAVLRAELSGGITAGLKVLTDFLTENNLTYNELIFNLQNKGTIK